MANRYPSDDYYSKSSAGSSRPVQGGRSNSAYGARPSQGSRSGSAYGARSAQNSRSGSAYGARPSGNRPSGNARPAQNGRPGYSGRPSGANGNRRPPQRRKKKPQGRFYLFLAIALILVLALIFIIVKPFSAKKDPAKTVVTDPVSATAQNDETENPDESGTPDEPEATHYSSLSEMLADSDAEVASLSEEEMVKVDNLSVNKSLPEEWLNVLLLGTDERKLNSSSRTDAMIICSIHRTTGEVKLTSIMRDTAVELNNIGKYSGTYRINAANYFGGADLAMKTVNEMFGMNIENYVMVNFFGFQKIAEKLGGITIDITEAEMNEINKRIVEQAKAAYRAGIDESDLKNEYLESYGENVHLDGRQTLAYARIRKTDNDYARTERQRTVLNELLKKLKTMNPMEIAQLAMSMSDQFKTNMKIDDIINIAMVVIGNGMSDIESMRLPVAGSYTEETRNNESMLWDADPQINSVQLYNFIYE